MFSANPAVVFCPGIHTTMLVSEEGNEIKDAKIFFISCKNDVRVDGIYFQTVG